MLLAASQYSNDPAEEYDGHGHADEASRHPPQICQSRGGHVTGATLKRAITKTHMYVHTCRVRFTEKKKMKVHDDILDFCFVLGN